ncbi:MAG TPA: cytochrome c [Candidatus Binatia bacterium]|nr:cytochrome c [Candidatus Binatia bacterium]
MLQRKYLLGGMAFFSVLIFSAQVFAQVDKRQDLMKGQSAANKAIKGAVEAKDFATIEAKAKDLMGSSEKIVGAFPKGSDKGKTKATAAIWDKSDDFAKAANRLSKAAGTLASAAKAKDEAAVTAGVKGVSDSCGGCHKAFRAEKYAE